MPARRIVLGVTHGSPDLFEIGLQEQKAAVCQSVVFPAAEGDGGLTVRGCCAFRNQVLEAVIRFQKVLETGGGSDTQSHHHFDGSIPEVPVTVHRQRRIAPVS